MKEEDNLFTKENLSNENISENIFNNTTEHTKKRIRRR